MDGAGGAACPNRVLGVEWSACGRRWRWRDGDPQAGREIAERLALPEIIGRLLAQRGIDLDHAPGFLEPRLRDQLTDPLQLRDMEAAVARLVRAVCCGETIAIFGDYDVDGATSAALLMRFFAAVGARTRLYVPDRLREGYGPNTAALLQLRGEGVRVVVTVDCGTNAHQPLEAAADNGLEVIVVDHHVAEPLLPRAAAVVNPNRLDEASPHGSLAAVGVVFLLVVAVNRALRMTGWYGAGRGEPDLLGWLDLVALGTVCDVVALTGLNRALVAQGIKVARRGANPGIAALAEVAGVSDPLDAYHLGFILGPRVNAGGRVGEAALGAQLLATDDPLVAAELAGRLDALQPRAPRDRGAHLGGGDRDCRSRTAIAGADLCGGGGLASRRDRHCRRAPQGALSTPGHGRGARRWDRARLGPLDPGHCARPGGDRRPPGRASDQWRRPCDGGRADARGETARRAARISDWAAGRRGRQGDIGA